MPRRFARLWASDRSTCRVATTSAAKGGSDGINRSLNLGFFFDGALVPDKVAMIDLFGGAAQATAGRPAAGLSKRRPNTIFPGSGSIFTRERL
jgi:hypothetical protein